MNRRPAGLAGVWLPAVIASTAWHIEVAAPRQTYWLNHYPKGVVDRPLDGQMLRLDVVAVTAH